MACISRRFSGRREMSAEWEKWFRGLPDKKRNRIISESVDAALAQMAEEYAAQKGTSAETNVPSDTKE